MCNAINQNVDRFLACVVNPELVFKKIFPTNTGVSVTDILATVHFLYSKLGSFPTWSTTSTNSLNGTRKTRALVGLIQMHCSPSFDCSCNKTTPLHVGTSYTHDIRFYSKRNVSATHHIVWAGLLNAEIAQVHPL